MKNERHPSHQKWFDALRRPVKPFWMRTAQAGGPWQKMGEAFGLLEEDRGLNEEKLSFEHSLVTTWLKKSTFFHLSLHNV